MTEKLDVVAVVGSLRRESLTLSFVKALQPLTPPSMRIEVARIADLPLYNSDDEASLPEPWARFRDRIKRADAVLFATPEYNRSIPGALKNAIDVGSRPYAQNAWRGKPAAIISVSPGILGAFGANHHLRQSLVAVNVPTMAQPEAYIGSVNTLLDADGQFTKPETREFCSTFLRAFEAWINVFKGA
ncbi:MAG: phosphodiesterase [Gammaproteobacteria bacterium]|nr:phosphodiesterase [Gammaproteobacteria bacterium]